MEKVKIKFKDGSVINADMNGNSYITDELPEIPIDLSVVTIESDEEDIELHKCEFVECAAIDDRYWFTFREISESEQLRADVDYLLCLEG